MNKKLWHRYSWIKTYDINSTLEQKFLWNNHYCSWAPMNQTPCAVVINQQMWSTVTPFRSTVCLNKSYLRGHNCWKIIKLLLNCWLKQEYSKIIKIRTKTLKIHFNSKLICGCVANEWFLKKIVHTSKSLTNNVFVKVFREFYDAARKHFFCCARTLSQ